MSPASPPDNQMAPMARTVCVACRRPIDTTAAEIACKACGETYPRLDDLVVLMPRPADHVVLWRRQLQQVLTQGEFTEAGLREEAARPETSVLTRARLEGLATGVRDQMRDLRERIEPALGGPLPADESVGLPRGLVDYVHHLYRDWGWPAGTDPAADENGTALAAIADIAGDAALGRTLVIGAGACRLAYDLHHRLGASDTVVVDIDPFTFLIARAVVRGDAVSMTESSPTVLRAHDVARRLTLHAPAGPLGSDVFHFLLANGLEPPFADGSFDTVVTPWFIDQVPKDLPAFLTTVARLLRPGGRWINQGPVLFPAETPVARRLSVDELLALAAHVGLPVLRWQGASRPYLVSPLSGRGRIEWVLTSVAQTESTA